MVCFARRPFNDFDNIFFYLVRLLAFLHTCPDSLPSQGLPDPSSSDPDHDYGGYAQWRQFPCVSNVASSGRLELVSANIAAVLTTPNHRLAPFTLSWTVSSVDISERASGSHVQTMTS